MTTAISSDTFRTYDNDSDGVLSADEMAQFLSATGQTASESFWDANSSGDITEAEFKTDMEIRTQLQGRSSGNTWTKGDFHVIDTNNDGVLTRDEWDASGLDRNIFTQHAGSDSKISEEEWDALIESIAAQKAAAASGGGGKK